MKILLFIYFFSLSYLFCQPLYTYEKYNSGPPKKVDDTGEPSDPNIIYWNKNIENNGLPMLSFDTFTLPLELLSYGSAIESEYQNCIAQWNQYGCLNVAADRDLPLLPVEKLPGEMCKM